MLCTLATKTATHKANHQSRPGVRKWECPTLRYLKSCFSCCISLQLPSLWDTAFRQCNVDKLFGYVAFMSTSGTAEQCASGAVIVPSSKSQRDVLSCATEALRRQTANLRAGRLSRNIGTESGRATSAPTSFAASGPARSQVTGEESDTSFGRRVAELRAELTRLRETRETVAARADPPPAYE